MENGNLKYKLIEEEPNIVWVNPGLLEDRLDAEFFKNKFLKYIDIEQKNKLKYKILGNIATNFSYGTPPYGNLVEKGVPYLRVPNIVEDFFLSDKNLGFISEEYHNDNIRNEVQKGDILFRVKGQLGTSVVVPERFDGAHAGSSFLKISLKEKYCPYFISLYISSKYGRNQILRKQSNSIINYLNISDVKSLKIPTPSFKIQNNIGEKVREAEKLRGDAKKLKKDIVDHFNSIFDIKVNKSKVWYLETKDLIDRLDCQYNNSYYIELEEQLKKLGCKVVNFGELIEKKMSEPQTKSSDFQKEGIPVLRITNIHEDNLDFKNVEKISKVNYERLKDFQIKPYDILFGLSGTIGRAIVVPEEIPEKAITNRRIAKVTLKDTKLAYYISVFLNSELGRDQLIRQTTGGVQKNLRLSDIDNVKIPLIDRKLIEKFNLKSKEKAEKIKKSKRLIQEAKKDVEDLIEGKLNKEDIQ